MMSNFVVGVPPDGMKALDQKLINAIGRTNAIVSTSFWQQINNCIYHAFLILRTQDQNCTNEVRIVNALFIGTYAIRNKTNQTRFNQDSEVTRT